MAYMSLRTHVGYVYEEAYYAQQCTYTSALNFLATLDHFSREMSAFLY